MVFVATGPALRRRNQFGFAIQSGRDSLAHACEPWVAGKKRKPDEGSPSDVAARMLAEDEADLEADMDAALEAPLRVTDSSSEVDLATCCSYMVGVVLGPGTPGQRYSGTWTSPVCARSL